MLKKQNFISQFRIWGQNQKKMGIHLVILYYTGIIISSRIFYSSNFSKIFIFFEKLFTLCSQKFRIIFYNTFQRCHACWNKAFMKYLGLHNFLVSFYWHFSFFFLLTLCDDTLDILWYENRKMSVKKKEKMGIKRNQKVVQTQILQKRFI